MTHFSAVSEVILMQLWAASWQGASAVLFVFTVIMAVRSLPASLQCWLWRLVSLKMVVVFFCFGAIELPLLPAVSTGTSDLRAPTVIEAAVEISGGSESELGAIPLNEVGVEQQQGGFGNALGLLLTAVWIVGVSWRAVAIYREWRTSVQLVHDSTPIDDCRICGALEDTAFQHGVSCPQLRESSMLDAPIVVGVAHPKVILPSAATNVFSISQVRLLLSHELAHIRRRDLLWNWLGVVSGVLFFFHPFVWLVQRRWRQAQESACDELVLDLAPSSMSEYAELLLRCSVPGLGSRFAALSMAVSDFTNLKKRIEQMKTRTPITTEGRLLASVLLVVGIAVGVIPWKIVAAATEDSTTSRTSAPETVEARVSVAKTFEIRPNQSVLAHDGPRPVDNRQAFRQQRRNARRLAMSGRNARGASRSGGTRSSAGGSTQIQGQNSSGAGGFASGTSERPNFVIALQLSSVDQPAMITVAEGSVAIDENGKEYEPMTHLGMARMSVPEFEISHPDCAGAYFRFSSKRRPKSFTEIRGNLRVTPIKLHAATFDIARLKRGDRQDTQFGPVSIRRWSDDDGWKFEVTTPGPGGNIREVFRYAGMVDVELVDSDGGVHKPRLEHGAGGGGGINGSSAGISEITQTVVFEELIDGAQPAQLVVRIRELGKPRLIPFTVEDVALTNYNRN